MGGVGDQLAVGVLQEDALGQHAADLVVDRAQRLVATGGALEQRDVALEVGQHVVDVRRQRDLEPLEGGTVGGRSRLGDQVVGRAAYDRLVERVLVAEVVVEQAAGDAGLLGQQVDRELVQRAGGQQPDPQVEQLAAALVRGQPGACGRGHAPHSIDTCSITPIPSGHDSGPGRREDRRPPHRGCRLRRARRGDQARGGRRDATSSCSRRAPTSAARGATTPTPVPPATSPASSTPTRSVSSTGPTPTPRSRRSRPTSSRSPTSPARSTGSSSTPSSRTPRGTTRRSAGGADLGRRPVTLGLRKFLIVGAGGLSAPKLPEIEGIETFQGERVPLRAVGPRCRPGRQAGRGHRHRRLGDPDRARAAEDSAGHGRPPRRLPAHRALDHPAQRPALRQARAGRAAPGARTAAALPHRSLLGARGLRAGVHPPAEARRAGAEGGARATSGRASRTPSSARRSRRTSTSAASGCCAPTTTTPPSTPTTPSWSPTRSPRSPATRSSLRTASSARSTSWSWRPASTRPSSRSPST